MQKNPIINLLKYAWRYSPSKKRFILFTGLAVSAHLSYLAEPLIIGRIFDDVQFSANDPALLKSIIFNLSLFIGLNILFWLLHGPSRVMEEKNAFLIRKNYKMQTMEKVLNLPAEWHKNHHSGDTIDKINKAGDNLFLFSQEIFMLAQQLIQLSGAIIILSFYDWKIALFSLFFSCFAFWSMLQFDKKLIPGYAQVFAKENYLASTIHDYVSNILTIITMRLKTKMLSKILERSMESFPIFKKNIIINEFKWASTSFYVSLMTAVALMWSAYNSYLSQGTIIIGTLFILYKYLNSMGSSFYNFAWKYGEIVKQNTAVIAAETINQEYIKLAKKINIQAESLPKNWQKIEIKNLVFNYKESYQAKNDIHNVNLEFSRGQKIALIGASGGGKSTVLSLLRGLHEAESGDVYADSKKMPQNVQHFYSHILLVPQDPEIFNATIKENITMGGNFKLAQIKKALELTCFDSVIKRLKLGLKTNIMEKGVSLSGGEKQRLALARGILAAPNYDFLLLDEPTSSVDSANELKIYQNIFKNFKDKTIFSSIHRLHLLPYFDYIYFFQKGRVIAEGTFKNLLKNRNFKVLWKNYQKHLED